MSKIRNKSELSFINKYGPWALLIGAAEGLGKAYTLALAQKGLNIVMIDNRKDAMHQLATSVEADFGIRTKTLWTDLAAKDAFDKISAAMEEVDCHLLVYNAAFSKIQSLTQFSDEELDGFIDVNARMPLKLVQFFVRKLKRDQAQGGILLMSSLAGLMGMQLIAPYAATKAFTWNLAESMHHELKADGIDVTACVSGTISTPAYLNTNPRYGFIKPKIMRPDQVANEALKKLGKKTLFIPGASNRFNYFILTRLLPRRWGAFIANHTIQKMYGHNKGE